jgi:hypothetical protein
MGMRRPKDLPLGERKLTYVLYDLCVKSGYCIPPADWERIAKSKEITAEEFAIKVLKAEGFAPEQEPERVRQIAAYFVEQVGADTLSASDWRS